MLTALNAWHDSDKLPEHRGGVYVLLSINYNGKRFVKKKSAHVSLKICYKNRQKFIIIHILS